MVEGIGTQALGLITGGTPGAPAQTTTFEWTKAVTASSFTSS